MIFVLDSQTSKQSELVLSIDDSSTRKRAIQNQTALNYASVDTDGVTQLKTKVNRVFIFLL